MIERCALGRSAQFGALYDVRTESFLGDSIFKMKLNDDEIDEMEMGDSVVELVLSDKLEDKFHKLSIEAELSVSVLSGMVKLSGSGQYLNEEKKSARTASMCLIYKVRTSSDEISIRQHRKNVDVEMLATAAATHVLVGIEWGAICTVTAEYESEDGQDVTQVNGALSAELENLKGILDAKGSVKADYEDKNKTKRKRFTFYSKCDVSTRSKDLPVTFEEAVEQAKILPKLVQDTNNGKGVPLKFHFIPMESVCKMFKVQSEVDIIFQSVREDTIKKTVQIVDDTTKMRQKLYDLQRDIEDGKEFVTDDDIQEVNKLVNTFLIADSKFKADLQETLKDIRSSKKEVSSLEALLSEFESSDMSYMNVTRKINEAQKTLEKLKFINSKQERGLVFIGKTGNVDMMINKTVFVLYTADNIWSNHEDKVLSFFWRLYQTHKLEKNVLFYIVDVTVRRNDLHRRQQIFKYVDGKEVSADLMKEQGEDADKCLVKLQGTNYNKLPPNDRAVVTIRCPYALMESNKCSGNKKTWLCSKCKSQVWYGIQAKKLHCIECKIISDPINAFYRCNEEKHGVDFIKFPQDLVFMDLDNLRALKEINILILGETGVGKSTWINGFANYLQFFDLKEAVEGWKKGGPTVLIPSKFTWVNDDNTTKDVKIGEVSENECFKDGQSATQEPVTHEFELEDAIVKLIDTPGIGDVRGIEQDKKNFQYILSHLEYYKEIHAICILLKPNNARLTVVFRFCIQQLLSHLHRGARDNIVFCFTNTRGTFYKPGDTLPALRKELEDKSVGIDATPHNMFCFDNEAFRFLACLHNGINFPDEDIEAFSSSWVKAVTVTKKLFGHINSMTPHKILNTTTLCDARRIILEFANPISQLTSTIDKNIRNMERHQQEISLLNKDGESTKENLEYMGTDLQFSEIDHPKTVCAHNDCREIILTGEDKMNQATYPQICHDHCYLTGVQKDTIGNAELMRCAAMTNNKCDHCNHSYSVHMHIWYDLVQVQRQFVSRAVQEKINEITDKKKKHEAEQAQLQILKEEFEYEKQEILRISATFGAYLKDFAIVPINDALGDYLDLQITAEEEKEESLRNNVTLNRLRESKKAYEAEKKVIEDSMKGSVKTTLDFPKEVKILRDQLFNLHHYGSTLKGIIDKIEMEKKKVRFNQRPATIKLSTERNGVSGVSTTRLNQTSDSKEVKKQGNMLRRFYNYLTE